MNYPITLTRAGRLSIAIGFAILFAVYHFHEFFQSITVSAITLLTFMVTSHVVARGQKLEGIKSWGLGLHRRWWLNLFFGLVLGFVFVGLSAYSSSYLGYERATASPGFAVYFEKIWWIMFMTFWPSLAEDILTRGYLFRHFANRMPAYTWVLFSAVVYVLNHIWRLTDHPAVLAYLFMLGLVLATAMIITRSLWLTLGIHWGANIVYYVTVDILAVESVADGRQSTWILGATYLLLFMCLLLWGGLRKRHNYQPQMLA